MEIHRGEGRHDTDSSQVKLSGHDGSQLGARWQVKRQLASRCGKPNQEGAEGHEQPALLLEAGLPSEWKQMGS